MNNHIIHIGYPKTGTTWFQKQFFPNIQNVEYIGKELYYLIENHNEYDFNGEEIRNYLLKKYYNNILLASAEEFLADGRNLGRNIIFKAKNIKQVFPNAKIIIFIRNQVDMMASRYSTYIKSGGNHNVKKFLFRENPELLKERDFSNFEYEKVIELYKTLFGKENVFIYLYEEFRSNPQEFLKSITDEFNFEVDLNNINYKEIENPRLNLYMIFIIRVINAFTKRTFCYKYYLIHIPYFYYFIQLLTKILFLFNKFFHIKHSSSKKILGKKNVEIINNYYKKSNNYIKKNYKLNIERFDYPI